MDCSLPGSSVLRHTELKIVIQRSHIRNLGTWAILNFSPLHKKTNEQLSIDETLLGKSQVLRVKLKDSWTTGIEKVGIRRVRGAGYTLTTLPFPQAGTATHQEGLPSLQCEKETQGRHQTLLTFPGGPLRSYLTGITRGVCGA